LSAGRKGRCLQVSDPEQLLQALAQRAGVTVEEVWTVAREMLEEQGGRVSMAGAVVLAAREMDVSLAPTRTAVIFTIGTRAYPHERDLVGAVLGAGATVLVDVRRLGGEPDFEALEDMFAPRQVRLVPLAGADVELLQLRDLGPPAWLLKAHREEPHWDSFTTMYMKHLDLGYEAPDLCLELVGRARKGQVLVLLCAEETPVQCHRKLLAEHLARLLEAEGVATTVTHIEPE
jgi:uncharacterized protein YeaO (DUF488 family)